MRRLLVVAFTEIVARLSREELNALRLLQQTPLQDQSHVFLVKPLDREPPPFDIEKFARELCPPPAPPIEFLSLKRQKRNRGFPGKRAQRTVRGQEKMKVHDFARRGKPSHR